MGVDWHQPQLPYPLSRAATETFDRLNEALEIQRGEGPWKFDTVVSVQRFAENIGIPRSTFFAHLKEAREVGAVRLDRVVTLHPLRIDPDE